MIMSWVNKAIRQSGLTQEEMAIRLNHMGHVTLDKSAVNKLLANERSISADEMFAIAKITNCPFPGQAKS
jgi:transcriptional regulator with XRE-family HTH domain